MTALVFQQITRAHDVDALWENGGDVYNLRLTQSLRLNPHHFDLHTFPSNQHQAFEYVIEDSTPIENEDAVMALGRPLSEFWQGLHDHYNTLRIPIRCQRASYLDVNELATKASTYEELHHMADRSQARFREVRQALDDISVDLITSYFPSDTF
ncbi:hypothetical protein F4824DRAFT_515778 [Ustulina deusta]|nr:hypothetical protein F4824DRAFT_515778 [Ustulina deusta]